jgi:formyltetrahydrofolate deformylase
MGETAILLISCPDRRGILAEVTGFIAKHGGNIIHADQHIDFQKRVFVETL